MIALSNLSPIPSARLARLHVEGRQPAALDAVAGERAGGAEECVRPEPQRLRIEARGRELDLEERGALLQFVLRDEAVFRLEPREVAADLAADGLLDPRTAGAASRDGRKDGGVRPVVLSELLRERGASPTAWRRAERGRLR